MTGRHRGGLAVSGDQAVTAGQGRQAVRSTTWFAAKRPSSGAAVPAEELATGWQTAASWQATTGRGATAGGGVLYEQAGRTNSGLPRRVPRTSGRPGWSTPGSGVPGTAPAADAGVPVLGAPSGGTAPQGLQYQEAPYQEAPYQEAAAYQEAAPYQEAPYQEQVPSRRRSPEAARSRLAGFQLGSRDAVQADHATGWAPFAREENSR